jgi:SAM-dependent methyltransferase
MGIKGDAGAHAARYEAVRPAILKGALALLPIHYPDFTFLDFGSGKGKALFIASSFPFQRIVGVEMSPSLTEIALANIRSYRDRKQKCHRIEASCCDAADFSIPNEPLTILFYNPFDSVVMRAVLDRITNSITEHPRPVYVIYVAPALSRMFIDYQYLRTLHTARGVVIYGFNPTPTQMRL